MSRHSKEQLQAFVNSPEFLSFLDALERDRYITLSEATRFWPLEDFGHNRNRRQMVGGRLKELSHRSCIDEGDYLPLSVPDRPGGLMLPSAIVPVLQLPECITNGPILVRDRLPLPDDNELEDICRQLRSRSLGSAEIRRDRVFGYSVVGLNLGDWGWGNLEIRQADRIDEAVVFSAGALHRFDTDMEGRSSVTIGSDALLDILSSENFLVSPNAVLLASALLRTIFSSHPHGGWDWDIGDYRAVGIVTFMPFKAEDSEEDPIPRIIVFSGAPQFFTLRRLFNTSRIEHPQCRFEFW